MKKSILLIALLAIISFAIVYYNDIVYGIRQGSGQIHIVTNSQPLDDFLKDPDFPDSLKQKINLIKEVRKFAIDSLGLEDSENYTSMYDQNGKSILWALNASPPNLIEPYEWCFPIAGCFPYKGYFNYELILQEQKEMISKGFDTYLRPVDGWSTLGFFNDPILSNMLNETEGELAELIIHEMCHATIYVKDSSELNEALASVVGDIGAGMFLTYHFGGESREYREYKNRLSDNMTFAEIMEDGINRLNQFYNTPQLSSDTRMILQKKNQLIKDIFCNVDKSKFKDPERFKWMELDQFFPNNAYFALYLTYNEGYDELVLEFIYDYNYDLRKFIQEKKKKFEEDLF